MKNICMVVLSFLVVSFFSAASAQDEKFRAPDQKILLEGEVEAAKFAGVGGPPFTIEQIRAYLPASLAVADKFEFLRNQRKDTLDVIANISTQLTATDSIIMSLQSDVESGGHESEFESVEYLESSLAMSEGALAELNSRLRGQKASRFNDESQQVKLNEDKAYFESSVLKIKRDLEAAKARDSEKVEKIAKLIALREKRDELAAASIDYQRLLGAIDDMVNQLFIASDASNSFKLKMSIAFSALVGVVIVGFFTIAWSNDEIKKLIFSNDAGIQFVTVFSIVIAVILFGIIGVLESKELSALLGGLSGYILGRSGGR
jgi:hypothetical protein